MKKLVLGDVVEIPTEKGYAYLQYVYFHLSYGYLVRVLPGIYREQLRDLTSLVEGPELYVGFVMLSRGIQRRLFRVVGRQAVEARFNKCPIFRYGLPDRDGKVKLWKTWDGDKTTVIKEFTKDHWKLPILRLSDEIALIRSIEEGWKPEENLW